ncbi:MAG: M20/M25/M40 family metallo-hydrolase [Candidatus Scalindua sp.]|nr:M20/M25/M40 family metallo-hydrolase [Candidatus Scalindua sp.]
MEKLSTELQRRLVALTRDLMLIPSDASRPDDISRCFEFVSNHVETLGGITIKKYCHKESPSMVLLPRNVLKPRVLFCAHLDVITHPDTRDYRSHIADGRIYGPGSADMKGPLAILLEIFRNFHTRYDNPSLGLVITSDEEIGGESGIRFLFDEIGLRCDVAMIPDGGSLNEVIVEEKGILHLKIQCSGHSSHAARPWLGDNPLERIVDSVTRLRQDFALSFKQEDDHWHPTCAVTIIRTSNQTLNRIPSEAEATLDIRFPKPYSVNDMKRRVCEVLGEGIDISTVISAEPTHLSPDSEYLKVTESLTGEATTLCREDGGSDARFVGKYDIPVIVSRPVVGELHSREEWIDISTMETFYRIYEAYLKKKLLDGSQAADSST